MWDTNSLAVAAGFTLSGRVHAVAMSPCATTHCLVAVGQAEPQVRGEGIGRMEKCVFHGIVVDCSRDVGAPKCGPCPQCGCGACIGSGGNQRRPRDVGGRAFLGGVGLRSWRGQCLHTL